MGGTMTTFTETGTNGRSELGPFVAAECLQLMRLHVEDMVGRGPLLGAGRMRGAGLIDEALGPDGTKLALVDDITEENGVYTVTIHEGACSFNRQSDEPMCTYTLGVFVGAIGAMIDQTMSGKEIACQAMGDDHCVYKIQPHIALG